MNEGQEKSEMTVLGKNLNEVAENETTVDKQETQEERYLERFVGEGKKYKTVEEAAEALAKKAVNADTHIETLINEKREVEQRAKAVDEVLAYIKESTSPKKADERVSVEEIQDSVDTKSLSEADILKVVQNFYDSKSQKEIAKATQDKAWEKLKEAAGDEVAAKLALTQYIGKDEKKRQLIDTMALTDPDGMVKLLIGEKKVKNFSTASESSRNVTENIPSNGPLTMEQIRKVRKENPRLYNSVAFQKRIHSPI